MNLTIFLISPRSWEIFIADGSRRIHVVIETVSRWSAEGELARREEPQVSPGHDCGHCCAATRQYFVSPSAFHSAVLSLFPRLLIVVT